MQIFSIPVNNPESIIAALVVKAALVNPANNFTLFISKYFIFYLFVVFAPNNTIVGVGS